MPSIHLTASETEHGSLDLFELNIPPVPAFEASALQSA